MSIDSILLEFVKANPGVGLYECADHLREVSPESFLRVPDPVKNSRTKANNRLKSLFVRGYLRRENPDGKKAVYFIKED